MTAIALRLFELPMARFLRRYWAAILVAVVMLALWVIAGFSLATRAPDLDIEVGPATAPPARLRAAAESTNATQLRQIAPTDALALNASIPVANLANPAARPFSVANAGAADRLRSLDCLTAAIYYEAAREPVDGQRAVAQVVLNRVRHPAYPATVCGVVFEGARRTTGCQFTFSCDGSLRFAPMAGYWDRARQVAQAALNGYVYAPVGWATHYHANYVVPYWASSLVKSANVGAHIFYRWRGGWGRPAAFLPRYGGVEPNIAWRGGFGQPTAAERLAAGDRDAAAAAAAAQAHPAGTVDSFQRAVLRRYEPLRRDTANAVIAERTGADRSLSNSQRWALTGSDEQAEEPQQRPLGRWGTTPSPSQENRSSSATEASSATGAPMAVGSR